MDDQAREGGEVRPRVRRRGWWGWKGLGKLWFRICFATAFVILGSLDWVVYRGSESPYILMDVIPVWVRFSVSLGAGALLATAVCAVIVGRYAWVTRREESW